MSVVKTVLFLISSPGFVIPWGCYGKADLGIGARSTRPGAVLLRSCRSKTGVSAISGTTVMNGEGNARWIAPIWNIFILRDELASVLHIADVDKSIRLLNQVEANANMAVIIRLNLMVPLNLFGFFRSWLNGRRTIVAPGTLFRSHGPSFDALTHLGESFLLSGIMPILI